MTKENKFIPYKIANFSSEELIEKSKKYFQEINKRRSVRDFSNRDVPKEVIENIIKRLEVHHQALTNNLGHFV